MMKLLQSGWMTVVLGTIVYLGTSLAILSGHKFSLPAKGGHVAPPASKIMTGPSWEYQNPEIDKLIADLSREKQVVADRAAELAELQKRLDIQRGEMNQITQRVFLLQKEFDKNVIRVREDEAVNLKKLAKMYASMSPAGAASIFKEMEDDQVVKQLVMMKEAEIARILEAFAKEKPEAVMTKRAAAVYDKLRLASTKPAPSATAAAAAAPEAAVKPKPK